nr:alpha/beta hydrolase [Bacillus rubiinfantis]
MIESSFTYLTSDQQEIYAKKWLTEKGEQPRAIVQLSHGMAEHIARYEKFARELVNQQIFVYGNDHRGHGNTGKMNNNPGYFADEDGFEKVVQDMAALTDIVEQDYPNVPIFLFGHSMGSFLSRRYIQLHGERLCGVILCGTGGDPGLIGKIGKFLAAREIKKQGRKAPSPFMNNLTFGSYNKNFRPVRTEFDWLTRDEKEVDKYINDSFCGGVFSSGFFYDLLQGLEIINKMENIKKVPVILPIYLISGSQDPVGNNTKGVLKTYQAFQQAGIEDVSYKFFEDARHELLNELNKDEVQADIIQWIKNILAKKDIS